MKFNKLILAAMAASVSAQEKEIDKDTWNCYNAVFTKYDGDDCTKDSYTYKGYDMDKELGC